MKKINKIFNLITAYILALLLIAFLGTYLSDYLNSINWFGDYVREYTNHKGIARTSTEWGARHYWYNWGLFFLFTASTIRCIFSIIELSKNYEPNNK